MKRNAYLAIGMVCCALLTASLAQPAQGQGRRPSDVALLGGQDAYVTRVIDGDTIEVTINGAPFTVQYAGIDAPELGECYGAQAARANASLVLNQWVTLERDINDRDPTGQHLLRYVYLWRGTMANEEMAQGGYARAQINAPDIKHQGDLNRLEAGARAARRGGWRACGWQSTVVKLPGICTMVAAERLMTRMQPLPELQMLNDGDCVQISKAENPEGPAWSGQFVYHPAGSRVRLTQMYVRWKDGFVLIQNNAEGELVAQIVYDSYLPPNARLRPGQQRPIDSDPYPGATRVATKPLERDPNNPQMVRLPNIRTWILRDLGDGSYEAMVDVFEYVSGDLRVPRIAPSGYLY